MGFGEELGTEGGTITFQPNGSVGYSGSASLWWSRMRNAVGLGENEYAGGLKMVEAAESQKLWKTILMWAAILGIPTAAVAGFYFGKRRR